MRYGRIYRGVVVSVTEPPHGRTIEQHVGPDQADHYTELPDDVGEGFKQGLEGNWIAPKTANKVEVTT